MAKDEGAASLGAGGLMYLLRLSNQAAARLERGRTPVDVANRILLRLNDDAQPSNFTPLELHFLTAVRQYGAAQDGVVRDRRSYELAVQKWGNEHAELIESGISQVLNSHFRAQADVVAALSDGEIGTIRRQIEREARSIRLCVIQKLRQSGEISADGGVPDVVIALRARAQQELPSEVFRMIVDANSREQLTLPGVVVAESAPFDEAGLTPLAVRLIEIRDAEARLPDLEREADGAFEALNTADAAARWDAAGH